MAPDAPLRLRAEDADDLAVISAIVQDALVSVNDLNYDRSAGRFTLVANRFRWEGKPDGGNGEAAFERTLCAVTIEGVKRASYRGFRRRDDDRILSLLAIRAPDPGEEGVPLGGMIDLEFSGGATVRLSVGVIRVFATDLGEAWPTVWQPGHDAGEAR